MVKAIVVKGVKKGTYRGRVAIRSNGYFNIKTKQETIQGISSSSCKRLFATDGYLYYT